MRVAFGEYQLDTETRTLQREGRRIPVQSKAFDLLAYLIERRERVVSSDELLDDLWPGLHVTPAALSTAVQKARQAVGDDGEHQTVLHTEHGKGFRFIAEVTNLSEPETAQPKPASFRARIAAVAGIAALLLVVALIWLSQRQTTEQIPGHSLAVLPFVNMSADADQEYFADGIAEELLNTLVRFEGLRVVGRTSSFSFKNSGADLKTIGEKLGVGVILEGSVRTAGDRVRITAQLVDAKDGFHRWSETYDRKLTDIFAIQTEIATAIATALRVSLSSEKRERLATPPTENVEAYRAYLLGNQREAQWTIASTEESIEYFQQAIELDPKFALAYVGLTESYLNQFEESDLGEMLARAQAAADKALELDDRLAEAHVALGGVKFFRNDFEGAETAYQRALALNPNSLAANLEYGALLGQILARYEEALALHRKVLELDPLSLDASQEVGRDLYYLGRFDEALSWYERVLEINPGYAFGYSLIGLHHSFVSG
jgi:adenylate cyclase